MKPGRHLNGQNPEAGNVEPLVCYSLGYCGDRPAISNGWTPARRAKQAEAIRRWKARARATGSKDEALISDRSPTLLLFAPHPDGRGGTWNLQDLSAEGILFLLLGGVWAAGAMADASVSLLLGATARTGRTWNWWWRGPAHLGRLIDLRRSRGALLLGIRLQGEGGHHRHQGTGKEALHGGLQEG